MVRSAGGVGMLFPAIIGKQIKGIIHTVFDYICETYTIENISNISGVLAVGRIGDERKPVIAIYHKGSFKEVLLISDIVNGHKTNDLTRNDN